MVTDAGASEIREACDEHSATIARRRANRKFMLCLRFIQHIIAHHHPSSITHRIHHPSHHHNMSTFG
jgi:hypothetical protein